VQGGALVGKLLAVEPLGYEVDTPAGLFLARGGPLSPALSELLINLGTTTATAALRFPPLRGLEGLTDFRTPAGGRLEVLKVSWSASARVRVKGRPNG
jgi:hypothetical protein